MTTEEKMPESVTWDQWELEVRQESSELSNAEFQLATDLLNHLVAGLAALNNRPTKNASEELVYALSLAATNSIYVVMKLAVSGWYNQALSITRDAFEFGLAASYALHYPDKAVELKGPLAKWPRPKQLRKALADVSATQDADKNALKGRLDDVYKFLSKFPHPSFMSASSVFEEDERTRLGPFYRRNWLLHCMDHVYRVITFFTSLLTETFPDRLWDGHWNREREELQLRVSQWVESVLEEYNRSNGGS